MKKLSKNTTFLLVLVGVVVVSFSFQSKFFEVAKQLEIYTTLFKELNMYYVNKINPAALTASALKNTLKDLDPYTKYFNEQDVETARIRREGEYGGIGVSINYSNKKPFVVRLTKGYSADKAGLKPGDVLTKIDDQELHNLKKEEVSGLLLGVPGSRISLEVKREGALLQFDLQREKVEVNPVSFYEKIDESTGYIALTKFNAKASSEVKKAFQNLKDRGMTKLILDLRGNPGGLLGEAIHISNFFLPKGKVITKTKAKVKKWSNTYLSRKAPLDLEMPIVVLVNGRSASASEIVTGALQDYDRAVVMGARSFGKGLVQRYRKLSYGTQLKVTISKYYTPSGRCIQELDYENRDLSTGKIPKFSDRGRNEFTTKNGRIVLDGGGIIPDIITEDEVLTAATKALLKSKLIFDFVVDYKQDNATISAATAFRFSDDNFKQFLNFVERDRSFLTAQEASFKKAYETLTSAQNKKISKNYLEVLKTLRTEKINSFIVDKSHIKNELQELVLDQYYYQEGVYKNKLIFDKTIREALALLKNNKKYAQVLSPRK